MGDKTLKCKDCGNDFVLTVKEQQFFVGKGLAEPKRCRDCRAKNKKDKKGGDK